MSWRKADRRTPACRPAANLHLSPCPAARRGKEQRCTLMLQGKELRDTCLGSATSGLVSRLLCHPLDTAKARLQGPGGSSFRNTWHVLRTTVAAEGVGGLYRGVGAVVVGGVPGTCIYLTTYEATKGYLADREAAAGGSGGAASPGRVGALAHLTAGMIAEIVCCVVYVPVDVVKERLQVQRSPSRNAAATGSPPAPNRAAGAASGVARGVCEGAMLPLYRGSADTLKTILRTEGLRGIYKGYLATVASFGPFSALYFMFYEQARAASRSLFERDPDFWQAGVAARAAEGGRKGGGASEADTSRSESARGNTEKVELELPIAVTLANAAAAAAAASWITNPLDLAKLRLQVQRGAAATAATAAAGGSSSSPSLPATAAPYSGMLDALQRGYRAGGVAGLFKGSGARMAFQAPSIAITMAAFEKSKELWGSVLS